jgi:transcriptional regulator with XRE-family HTH domain
MLGEEMIGRQIRRLRLERRMTQDVLARAAGLTKGYLSKIENSPTSPPVSTLIEIASALGVGIESLFSQDGSPAAYAVLRRADRQEVARKGSSFGYSYQPLGLRFPNRHMDPYVMSVPAGAGRSAEFSHSGEELLFLLKGRVNFRLGRREVLLEEGDCIYFNASIPHSGESVDGGEIEYFAVFFTKEAGGAKDRTT